MALPICGVSNDVLPKDMQLPQKQREEAAMPSRFLFGGIGDGRHVFCTLLDILALERK